MTNLKTFFNFILIWLWVTVGVSRNEHLREIEEAAEEVLSDKQEIVDLDRKRCQNREAIRAMDQHLNHASSSSQWLAMGNCFFKLPQDKAKTLLQKGKVYKKMTIFAAEKTNVTQNNYGLYMVYRNQLEVMILASAFIFS